MTSTCINKRSSYTITCQLLDLTCLSFQNYLLNDSIALVISREKGLTSTLLPIRLLDKMCQCCDRIGKGLGNGWKGRGQPPRPRSNLFWVEWLSAKILHPWVCLSLNRFNQNFISWKFEIIDLFLQSFLRTTFLYSQQLAVWQTSF